MSGCGGNDFSLQPLSGGGPGIGVLVLDIADHIAVLIVIGLHNDWVERATVGMVSLE